MLKKKLVIALAFLITAFAGFSQGKYFTKTGKIDFSSKAPLEDIEAKNKTVTAVIDSKSGAVQFAVQMKGFEFEKQLMQQHFNENYIESDKYPKGEFRGTITNNSGINYSKEVTYPDSVIGKLTIHGVTRNVETSGNVKVTGGKLEVTSSFNIRLSDYKISIPAVVKDKVSNSIRITVNCRMDPL